MELKPLPAFLPPSEGMALLLEGFDSIGWVKRKNSMILVEDRRPMWEASDIRWKGIYGVSVSAWLVRGPVRPSLQGEEGSLSAEGESWWYSVQEQGGKVIIVGKFTAVGYRAAKDRLYAIAQAAGRSPEIENFHWLLPDGTFEDLFGTLIAEGHERINRIKQDALLRNPETELEKLNLS